VADSAVDLPARQSKALRGAFGLTAGTVPPDRLLTGIAALTLLSGISEVSPLLVTVDDAHLLDRSSLDVLSFVGRRLGAERVVLVLGGRGPAPLAGLDSGFPELRLEPLLASDANRLLDCFGPARLMFGSDWPVCTLAASYPGVLQAARDLTAGLSPAEREAVFSGTASRIYGL